MVAILLAFGVCVSAQATIWQPPGVAQLSIWPGAAPDAAPITEPESFSKADNLVAGKPWWWVTNVSTPTITVFPAKGKNTGAAVIVFPGGGFMGLAIDLEGTEVCDWLTSKGISCVLLKYRVPRSEDYYDMDLHRHVEPKVLAAFQDAQRTISLVRSRAAQWSIDPNRIGVLGFSAGGYLAAKTSTEFKRRGYQPVDAADQASCRPDFSVPIYPGHLWKPRGKSPEFRLNSRIHITPQVPPTFLLMAEDDHVDYVEQALIYYGALKKAKVPIEMHLYATGGHAFGLRRTEHPITRWPELVETWLRTIGMISDKE
ncbi:MAG: alpha/beta hydrolase [Elusimicrobia bacterium]|nr:alpha/beta hydrolase [Elusimicrobiota bacterium]